MRIYKSGRSSGAPGSCASIRRQMHQFQPCIGGVAEEDQPMPFAKIKHEPVRLRKSTVAHESNHARTKAQNPRSLQRPVVVIGRRDQVA